MNINMKKIAYLRGIINNKINYYANDSIKDKSTTNTHKNN